MYAVYFLNITSPKRTTWSAVHFSTCDRQNLTSQHTFSIVVISNPRCSFVPQLATEELRLQDCITCQGNPLRELLICKEVKSE